MGFFDFIGKTVSSITKPVSGFASKTFGQFLQPANSLASGIGGGAQAAGQGLGQGAASLGQGIGQGLGSLAGILSSPFMLIGVGVLAVVVLPKILKMG